MNQPSLCSLCLCGKVRSSITRRRNTRGDAVREAVQPLPIPDQTVAFAGEALDGAGVCGERVAAGAEAVDLEACLLRALLFRTLLGADATQLEEAILAAEDGEIAGSGEEQQAEEEAYPQKESRP